MSRFHLFALGLGLAAASLLAGCATPPLALAPSHPASVDAAEAATPPARATLRPDASTLRTRELLAQREQQAQAAESEMAAEAAAPGPTAPRTAPGPMQGMEGMNHANP